MPAHADEATTHYSATVRSLPTDVRSGYQLAQDPIGRRIFIADAQWSSATVPVTTDEAGNRTYGEQNFVVGSGKVVRYDAATDTRLADHSYLGLARVDGSGPDGEPFDVDLDALNPNAQGVISLSSMRTTSSPYGIAVDATTTNASGERDATIITTTARNRSPLAEFNYGGSIVMYSESNGGPVDSERIFAYPDDVPVFDGARRISVHSGEHLAFVTNLGTGRSTATGDDARAGYVTVLDTTKRGLDAVVAQVAIPLKDGRAIGALDVEVDEANSLVYVGTIGGESRHLWVIDIAKIVKSDARTTSKLQSQAANVGAVTALPEAVVGNNARPAYSPEQKRLYVSSYDEQTITVVEADPTNANYGDVVEVLEVGPTNSVTVDGERGLFYSANLGDREVVVYSTDTHEVVTRAATSGNAINIVIDPVSRDAWVSNFSSTGIVDVITVTESDEPGEDPDPDPSTPAQAEVQIPENWVEGESLAVSGTGWVTADGTGSTIAVKLNRGGTALKSPLGGDVPADVWAVIEADATGSWTAELDFPSADLTDSAWNAEGTGYTVAFLSGSLAHNDIARGKVLDITVTAAPAVDPDPSEDPTEDPTEEPSPAPAPERDLYETPGFHNSGDRRWMTVCEDYSSSVQRCWTYIWATTVVAHHDTFVPVNGWAFNNLTYVGGERAAWAGNPLAQTGSWTNEGREWRTECDTANTGRGGCRSYIVATVIERDGNTYR